MEISESNPTHLDRLVDETVDGFRQKFGRDPSVIVAAPGRVNLAGGHVDYNEGIVLPMAIDRYTIIAGDVNSRDLGQIISPPMTPANIQLDLSSPIAPEPKSGWANYVRGVAAGFQRLAPSQKIPGFDALIGSNIPIGSGLSSSAALEVSFATLLEQLVGIELQEIQKATLCQNAEYEFAGVPCGLMDQLSVIHGRHNHLMVLDCHTQKIDWVPWDNDQVTVLILNSNAPHQLNDSEYALRRQQCQLALQKLEAKSFRDVSFRQLQSGRKILNETEFRRARHVITEIERCQTLVDAIDARDWIESGRLLFECHDSIRDDFQVSCDELDFLVHQAKLIGSTGGMFGMRMTGGGFGGCTVAIVDPKKVNSIIDSLATSFQLRFGHSPTPLIALPSNGAFVVPSLHDR